MNLSGGLSSGLAGGLNRLGSAVRSAVWTPFQLPGIPREWLAGPEWCFTDGSAVFAAASSQSLSVANNSDLQTGGASFWFSCWANHTTTTGNQAYAGKRNTGQFEWGLWHQGGAFTRFQVIDRLSGGDSVADAASATAGVWRHLFCWYDAVANTVNISVNGGTPTTVANIRTLTAGTAPFRLGAFDGGTSLPYDGRLACAAFGKSPPGGIAAIATTIRDRLRAGGNGIVYADTTPAERTAWGLVSWWDLVRGGNFNDSHGTNNLTNNNGVGFGAGLPRARAGDTDPVSAWVDRWQGTTWTEADPLRRLVLRNLGGGRWVLRSDGVNDGIGSGPATTGARTIAASYTQTVGAASTRLLQAASGVSSLVSPRRASGGNITVGGTVARGTVFSDDSNPHVFSMQRSAAGPWRAWADGVSLVVTDQTANFGSLGVGAFTGAGAAETWTGDLYSVVDTNADISDADRARLTTYLASLYGGVL